MYITSVQNDLHNPTLTFPKRIVIPSFRIKVALWPVILSDANTGATLRATQVFAVCPKFSAEKQKLLQKMSLIRKIS